ncbi:MAG: hypothetical protein PW788_15280 [Micavibrio sp.]|nr:hypothetical protein [Micavibrio sp.]
MTHLKDFHLKDYKDYALHSVVSLGVAVPLLFCAATGFTSESLEQAAHADANYASPYASGQGAVPLESTEGWQVHLRTL